MSKRTRIIIFSISMIVYVVAFVVMDIIAKKGQPTVGVIPAIVAGWLFGLWPSVIVGVLIFPLNVVMLTIVGMDWHAQLLGGGGIAGTPAIIIMGAVVGRMRDLSVRLRQALIEKTLVEEELRNHRDNLDRLVRERTTELQLTKDRLEQLVRTSLDPIVISDRTGTITVANSAFLKAVELDEQDVLGHHIYEFSVKEAGTFESTTGELVSIGSAYFEEARRGTERLYESGSISDWPGYLRKKDGRIFPLTMNIVLLYDDKGEVAGAFGILRDVTEQRKAEITLVAAKETAEAANEAKSNFLANMSHELRTPLNAVIGFTEILSDTPLSSDQAEYAQTVRKSGEALLSLVNDILDFSKIEAGKITLEERDFDIEILAHDMCDLISPRLFGRDVELLCRIDDNLPAMVKGDPHRYRQILANLMGNAAKFTDMGEIELSMALGAEEDGRFLIHAMVRDTGIGIPQDKTKIIFNVFQQADTSTTRKYGGTGLGLSIARKMARCMGGDVWVESDVGKGSTFHFTATLQKAEERDTMRSEAPVSLRGKRVLLADDNATSLEILTHMLKSVGITAAAFQSGEQALQAFQQAQEAGTPFDICVLDISMPEKIKGPDLAREIRALAGNGFPLLAFASVVDTGYHACEEAGCNGFLPKPIKREKLFKMMERLLHDVAGDKQHATDYKQDIVTLHSMREDAKQKTSILLVEDNAVNQKFAVTLLIKAGYHVTVADNGKIGVDTFVAAPEKYDIIFMDMQMPEMNGLDAARIIRQKGFARIPIVAMTANAMEGDRERCLESGMDDYISKPIKRDLVFAMLQKWVFEREDTG